MKMRRIVVVVDVPARAVTSDELVTWVREGLTACGVCPSAVTAAYELAPKEPVHAKEA